MSGGLPLLSFLRPIFRVLSKSALAESCLSRDEQCSGGLGQEGSALEHNAKPTTLITPSLGRTVRIRRASAKRMRAMKGDPLWEIEGKPKGADRAEVHCSRITGFGLQEIADGGSKEKQKPVEFSKTRMGRRFDPLYDFPINVNTRAA